MLTSEQRTDLNTVIRKRYGNAALVRRARFVLLWADGERRVDIRSKRACNDRLVSRWTTTFEQQGLAGLVSLHSGRARLRSVVKLEARVLNRTFKHLPQDGSTHWSSRELAAELGDVSFLAVQRIWRKHGVRPDRLDVHMISNDPDLEAKATDVIGLYLNPPDHVAVFCVDAKTAIQALDRKDRMLSPGRAESHGFEYKRNGTLSLFGALNTATGEVIGKTASRHTANSSSASSVTSSKASRSGAPSMSSATTSAATRRRPSKPSWPNIVAAISTTPRRTCHGQPSRELVRTDPARRDQARHLHFPQRPGQKLMQCIRQYNKEPKPLKWKYDVPTKRTTASSSDSVV